MTDRFQKIGRARTGSPALRTSIIATVAMCLILAICFFPISANACPFCSGPSLTISEQLQQSDTAVLAQWVGGTPASREKNSLGSTQFQVVEVLHDTTGRLHPSDKLEAGPYRAAKSGDLFLLIGTKNSLMWNWSATLEVTEISFNYIKQTPSKEGSKGARLAYFMKFLEFSDPLIANDAFAEFANSSYKDVALLVDKMPRLKIRKWIADPQTQELRLGLYGMMLGLCGQADDAAFLKAKIAAPIAKPLPIATLPFPEVSNSTEKGAPPATSPALPFRPGIDGLIAGYLMLAGEEGLKFIEQTKFHDAEAYSAAQALRFLYSYSDRFSKDRLRSSLRLLLDDVELRDLIITDLTRWEDWNSVDRLQKMFDEPTTDKKLKRAIVCFYIFAEKKSKTLKGETPAAITKAKEALEKLKESDPNLVQEANNSLFLFM